MGRYNFHCSRPHRRSIHRRRPHRRKTCMTNCPPMMTLDLTIRQTIFWTIRMMARIILVRFSCHHNNIRSRRMGGLNLADHILHLFRSILRLWHFQPKIGLTSDTPAWVCCWVCCQHRLSLLLLLCFLRVVRMKTGGGGVYVMEYHSIPLILFLHCHRHRHWYSPLYQYTVALLPSLYHWIWISRRRRRIKVIHQLWEGHGENSIGCRWRSRNG